MIFVFQVSQSKRLKSDIATLEYDLAALKKVGAQQRNDLKSIGNLIMSELKSLREKALEHEESLNKECKISQKFTTGKNRLKEFRFWKNVIATGKPCK